MLTGCCPGWDANVWGTPTGRNVDAECFVELERLALAELAVAGCALGLPPPFDAGAGGALPFTALMIPLRMLCARLGCGGGAEDETAAAELTPPVDAVAAPAAAAVLVSEAAAPAAKPLAPDRSAQNATAPPHNTEYTIVPTSTAISPFSIHVIITNSTY